MCVVCKANMCVGLLLVLRPYKGFIFVVFANDVREIYGGSRYVYFIFYFNLSPLNFYIIFSVCVFFCGRGRADFNDDEQDVEMLSAAQKLSKIFLGGNELRDSPIADNFVKFRSGVG